MGKKKETHPDEILREQVAKFQKGVEEKTRPKSHETNSGSAPTNGYAKGDSENLYR